ncbi:DNA topoisomerase I [Beijerinckiaceae bacterium RH AL1]|nr:DNA topoisomerase IB [Beijerinckiaceae bacterium]VVB43358.1 DNA topoisomerase I [Beijerinckiaceae bacterium RH AL8]VVB43373.1 DNA topoisomerase I [Beijerinckiaceae bacterium RH CH11]VVC53801.1 DNA topoisomerase I [Beijerinckiaceae bacterium RH AL1]
MAKGQGKAAGTRTRTAKPKAVARATEAVAQKIEACEEKGEACEEAAEAAGLVYVSDEDAGITRKRSGKGWRYIDPKGRTIRDYWERKRIDKIAVPPAYTDVWICPDPNGHIQATGRDDRGRKQYRYHPKWTEARDTAKYERMVGFARLLPDIRARVAADMRRHGLPREKVAATLVALLEKTLIRVGNEDYARENKSFGLTTLRNRHLEIDGSSLRFDFKGKSGKMWNLDLRDRRVAKVVRSIQELPGQKLFQYLDDDGKRQPVSSSDVNAYLREITGEDVTAKDFRTWAGTVLASLALAEFETVDSQSARKKNVKAAIESVAKRLGNTPTICRKCYVHPRVLDSYLDGTMLESIKQEVEDELGDHAHKLRPEEAAVLGLLSRRIGRDLRARAQ